MSAFVNGSFLAGSLLWAALIASVIVEGDIRWVARVKTAIELMPASDRDFVIQQHKKIFDVGCGAYVETHTTGIDCGYTDPIELGGVLVHEAMHHWDEAHCVVYVGARSEERALRRQADYLRRKGYWDSALSIEAAIGKHGDPTNSLFEIPPNCPVYFIP